MLYPLATAVSIAALIMGAVNMVKATTIGMYLAVLAGVCFQSLSLVYCVRGWIKHEVQQTNR
jgi:hypothetical protein